MGIVCTEHGKLTGRDLVGDSATKTEPANHSVLSRASGQESLQNRRALQQRFRNDGENSKE